MTASSESVGTTGDTSAEALRIQVECYRRMPTWRKVELCMELGRLSDSLALVGIAERFPSADDAERRRRLFALKHGDELVQQAFHGSAAG